IWSDELNTDGSAGEGTRDGVVQHLIKASGRIGIHIVTGAFKGLFRRHSEADDIRLKKDTLALESQRCRTWITAARLDAICDEDQDIAITWLCRNMRRG